MTNSADHRGRWSARLGLCALLVAPISYAWIPLAGRDPGIFLALIPIAEFGALVSAGTAVVLGYRARRQGAPGRRASLGLWLGLIVISFVIGGNLVGALVAS